MFANQHSNPFPLAGVISSCVALDDALSIEHYPQARHHARVIALRGNGAGFDGIATSAMALMNALDREIRPARAEWGPVVERLHRAIDEALVALPSDPTE